MGASSTAHCRVGCSRLLLREVYSRLASLIVNNYWQLPRQPLQDPDIQAAYYSGDKRAASSEVAKLWQDLGAAEGL